MNKLSIFKLSTAHSKNSFDCGNVSLNEYIRKQANQDMKRGIAHAMVITADGSQDILGYYTLSATSLLLEELQNYQANLPKYDRIPAVLLGRLAVDINHQNKKISSLLLIDAIKRAYQSEIAWHFFLVNAIDDKACKFYKYFGFSSFAVKPNLMWLRYKDVKAIIEV